jgi:HPt (histidine-containing phosphotransfer) domain-containing protein
MTANAMAGDREKVLEAGMNDHIAKPINVAAMFQTMARWICVEPERQGAGSETGESGPAGDDPCEAAADDMGIPVDLPGIDVGRGMRIVQGDSVLYRRLLTKFRNSQGDFAERFEAPREGDDPGAATRAAHTLKGVAGNIGAAELEERARALESACVDNDGVQLPDLLAQVLAELQRVLDGLAVLDDGASPKGAEGSVGLEAEQLRSLQTLLQDYDSDAVDLVETWLQRGLDQSSQDLLGRIQASVAEYDFDSALETVNAYLEQAG